MEFLKEVLGEELYPQVKTAIDAFNGNDENKDNQIKLGNLGKGEYVGKMKYDSLQEILNGKETELTGANELIAELKKSTKGSEDLQAKITQYEAENEKLQQELADAKLKAAIKVELLTAKAVDVDYLTFKLEKKLERDGKSLELDENDNIKNWNNELEGLKTQFPKMFETATEGGGGSKIIEPNKLAKGEPKEVVTKDEFTKMNYEQRLQIKQKDEGLYKELSGR